MKLDLVFLIFQIIKCELKNDSIAFGFYFILVGRDILIQHHKIILMNPYSFFTEENITIKMYSIYLIKKTFFFQLQHFKNSINNYGTKIIRKIKSSIKILRHYKIS